MYKCPNCFKEFELATHNVKRQIKSAKERGTDAVCTNCTLVIRNTTHGKAKTPSYRRWYSMIQRCENPDFRNYERWGGVEVYPCVLNGEIHSYPLMHGF